ncbi:hypothetical protein EV1_006069 [Malus domestica]
MESNTAVIFSVFVAVFVQSVAAHTAHVVGDDMGWTVPVSGAQEYVNWAASYYFTHQHTRHYPSIEGIVRLMQCSKTHWLSP